MKKLIWIILFFIICGCTNKKSVACQRYADNIETYIDIQSINDDITLINVKEVFIIDYDLLMDNDIKTFLDTQIDESYYFIDNKLIKEYNLIIDNKYSLSKTLEYLKKEKYLCG